MIKRKKKKCNGCNEMKYIFGHGYCDYCYKINKNTPIKKASAKLEANRLLYKPIRNKYLRENKFCNAKASDECTIYATEVHHKKGRDGDLLIDTKYFLPVCRNCHDTIETMGTEVYEKGFKIKRSTTN